ncbi:MAG: ABC-F family ATP-binding cassette domain-containing protein [Lachnospiraceae bacterium]|nr:ABC-F family ATP-binding cassette domain-containing protein [Lachnospiraceae bacterium]
MILSVNNLSKTFVADQIIKDASFHIEDNEKAAIVGINGAGKSTLLKMITGELTSDTGEVTLAKNVKVGYLAQNREVDTDLSVYDEVLKAREDVIKMESELRDMEEEMKHVPESDMEEFLNRYHKLADTFDACGGNTYRSEVSGVLKGLGFDEDDFDKKVSNLSGGQKTRVNLARLLALNPNLLILDEPTNHLDISSIAWLENYLYNYKGAVLLVSHDRYFLDKVVSKVIEVFQHKVYSYSGNYSDYAQKKAMVRKSEMKAYLNQQKVIEHEEAVIEKLKSFIREKSIKRAESREKMLDKIERLDKPVEDNTEIKIKLEPSCISGNDVLSVRNLSKAFGENRLFENVGFEIKRGDKVALIGENGTGKTTILKIINGLESADDGQIKLGTNVEIGYYDQEHQVLHMEKTLFEEISDEHPDMNNTKIRNVLAAFLFTDDDVFKRVSDLSGGERGRLSLAKLMLSKANFLILDEPTNHLDITSKEILEDAINSYTGTVLYVSHDRYFVNKTAGRVMDLTKHQVINYIGNYDYYLEKRDIQNNLVSDSIELGKAKGEVTQDTSKDDARLSYQKQKEDKARIKKLESKAKQLEEDIYRFESEKSELEEEMMNPEIAANSAKLNEISLKISEIDEKLSLLYEEWDTTLTYL